MSRDIKNCTGVASLCKVGHECPGDPWVQKTVLCEHFGQAGFSYTFCCLPGSNMEEGEKNYALKAQNHESMNVRQSIDTL